MTELPPTNAISADAEGELARLCEEISDRLRRQEPVDLEDYAARWPAHADELRQLLPAMRMMAGLQDDPEPTNAIPLLPTSMVNETLGDFRILHEVGRGGMGVVYEAEQLSLRRRVALKVLPFAAVLDSRQLRRFQNEAQAAALLHHPQIVPVYGVGCDRGVHYYAMQLINGPTLASVIRHLRTQAGFDPPPPAPAETKPPDSSKFTDSARREPDTATALRDSGATVSTDPKSPAKSTAPHGILSSATSHRSASFIQAAVQLGIEVAEALDYAHQEGIIHRDIKPGNLLLDERGRVWVADFGLARMEADPGMTLTGDLVGTLRYMSPEQALGNRAAIDGRSDIYSLGATLYELLTLEPVFKGDDKQAILRQIAFDEPRPPRQFERGILVELETILLKTLAKHPDERYTTASELADDLRRFQQQRPIRARRPSLLDRGAKWALRNRHLMAVGTAGLMLAVIILAAANVLIWREQYKTQDALDATAAARSLADQEGRRAANMAFALQRQLYVSNMRLVQQYAEHAQHGALTERLNEVRRTLRIEELPRFAWDYWWRRCRDAPLFVLPGQQRDARVVSLSADGLQLATGEYGTARIWDVHTGRLLHVLTNNDSGGVTAMAFSPSGKRLACGSSRGQVTEWDISSERLILDQVGHGAWVRELHFTSDEISLLSTDAICMTQLWDVQNGQGTPAHPVHAVADTSYAWSSDDRWVATAGYDDIIRVMDLTRNQSEADSVQKFIPVPRVPTVTMEYIHNNQQLIWVAVDGQVQIIELDTPESRKQLQLPVQHIIRADVNATGNRLVTMEENRTMRLWDAQSGESLAVLENVAVDECHISRNGETVAMIGPNAFVAIWQPLTPPPINPQGHERETWCLAFSPDGRWLVSGSDDETVRIWQSQDGAKLETLRGHTATVTDVEFSPDGKTLASSSLDASVRLWTVDGWRGIRTLSGHERRACCLTFSPSGRQLASGGDKILVWHVQTGATVKEVREDELRRINAIQFSPDGTMLAAASSSGRVLILETNNWNMLRTLPHSDEVWAIAFSPDSRTLATGDKSGTLRVWDVAGSHLLYARQSHTGYIRAMRFTHDGRTLASGGDDQRIRLWDPVDGGEICCLDGHVEKIYALAFSPDDGLLASGSYDGAIRFWHAEKVDR